jgi:hypothetical protein
MQLWHATGRRPMNDAQGAPYRDRLAMSGVGTFWTGTFSLTDLTRSVPRGQDSPGTMAASIIARWSSMLGGISDAREEITMTARRSGTTVIS